MRNKTVLYFFAPILLVAVMVGAAKTKVPAVKYITHFLSYDLEKNAYAPYDATTDQQLFVIGPTGQVEPGVEIGVSKDGTKVLVGPPEFACVMLEIKSDSCQAPEEPLTPSKPAPESQAENQ